MEIKVELDHLSKHFGPVKAVDGISLTVNKGEVLGFLGPNGAGKSTTMRLVAGFLTPTAGRALVCGHDVATDPVAVKSIIGYMAEGSPSYEDMTVRAFLNFIADIRGVPEPARSSRIAELIEKIALGAVIDRPIDVLSKGFKRRVGLAQAILHDPPVLILDEPTDGLDPNQKHQVRSLIKEMAPNKVIIVSTHILEEVEAVCTRAVIIGNGKLLADGTAEELLSQLPEHNAICVVVDANATDSLTAQLQSITGVAKVERTDRNNGKIRLRCIPANGTDISGPVSAAVRTSDVEFLELYQDRGDLDSVFRQITTEEGGTPHA